VASTSAAFNGEGGQVSSIDAAGNSTTFTFDPTGLELVADLFQSVALGGSILRRGHLIVPDCPMFVPTAEFLPQHHAQQRQTLQIITAAEANRQARVAEPRQDHRRPRDRPTAGRQPTMRPDR
jgi:hypothetical protein